MDLKSIFFGFVLSLFPLMVLFRVFRGKFLFVTNPYLKGALMGIVLWVVIAVLFYLDGITGFIGILHSESGFAVFSLFTSSLHGFLTAGLVVGAFFRKTAK